VAAIPSRAAAYCPPLCFSASFANSATDTPSAASIPELANCRRVRFDTPTQKGKPWFRLIYRNEPSDGAPAECHWLTVAPRAGLRAHRKAQKRLRSD